MTRKQRPNRESPWWAREGTWGVFAVFVVHGMMAWWFIQPLDMPEGENDAIEVIFLTPRQSPVSVEVTEPPAHSVKKESEEQSRTSPRLPHDPGRVSTENAPQTQALSESTNPTPPQMIAPTLTVEDDDQWNLLPDNEVSFRPNPFTRPPNPFGPLKSNHFRMRKELSPEDVVRGVSQMLGFWPPGYTDDPCGGIRRSVEMLSMPTDDASRRQLADALEAKAKYCQ